MFDTALHAHDLLLLAQEIGPSAPEAPPGEIGEKFQSLMNLFYWGAIAACAVAFVAAGVTLAWQRHNGSGTGEGEAKAVRVMVGAVFVASATQLINWLAA
jgi:hypothetical protein